MSNESGTLVEPDRRRSLNLRSAVVQLPGDDGDAPSLRLLVGSRLLRMEGADTRRILELLDGSRTLDELCAALPEYSAEDVEAAVDALQRLGVLEPPLGADLPGVPADRAAAMAPQLRALFRLGIPGTALLQRTQDARAVVVAGGALAEELERAALRIGLGTVETVSPQEAEQVLKDDAPDPPWDAADMTVVGLGSENPRLLERINAHHLETKRPWLLVQTSEFGVRVGPLFWPMQTACYTCYVLRLEANSPYFADQRAVRRALLAEDGEVPGEDAVIPLLASLASELAALEVLKYFASEVSPLQPSLYGKFIDYSPLALEGTTHRVLRLPRCPACGAPATGDPTVRAWMEPYDYRTAD